MSQDKQLRDVRLEEVVKKRNLDQALNAKEFAVLAGISYSAARSWFRQPGFPVIRGVVFWRDFVQWRIIQSGLADLSPKPINENSGGEVPSPVQPAVHWPPRATRILREMG